MNPSVVLPVLVFDNKIMGPTTGGFKISDFFGWDYSRNRLSGSGSCLLRLGQNVARVQDRVSLIKRVTAPAPKAQDRFEELLPPDFNMNVEGLHAFEIKNRSYS